MLMRTATKEANKRILFRLGSIAVFRVGQVEDGRDIEHLMVLRPFSIELHVSANMANPQASSIQNLSLSHICPFRD